MFSEAGIKLVLKNLYSIDVNPQNRMSQFLGYKLYIRRNIIKLQYTSSKDSKRKHHNDINKLYEVKRKKGQQKKSLRARVLTIDA